MATTKTTTTTQYGIRIIFNGSPAGWIVGQDGDVMLFPNKPTATETLKKMKTDDRYSWNCVAEVVEFIGWGK